MEQELFVALDLCTSCDSNVWSFASHGATVCWAGLKGSWYKLFFLLNPVVMSDVAGLCSNTAECMTDFHVNLYALSPFIVHMLLRQQCSPPTSDKTIQEASHGIQMDILRTKFSTENSWDMKEGDLSRDALLPRIVSGEFHVIFNPVAFHECHGVPYEGRADLLHRIMNGSQHQYMVKVVASTKALRPQIVMKALFCHHVLSLMLGKDRKLNKSRSLFMLWRRNQKTLHETRNKRVSNPKHIFIRNQVFTKVLNQVKHKPFIYIYIPWASMLKFTSYADNVDVWVD